MKISLSEIASRFNYEKMGNEDFIVQSIAPLEKAQKHQVSFLSNSKYLSQLKSTQAGIVILSKENSYLYLGNKIIVDDPYVAFAKIASLFTIKKHFNSGIHSTAIVSHSAKIDTDVCIGPYCVIGDDTNIKSGTVLEAHVIVGDNCNIGSHCIIKSNAVISDDCYLGNRVILHPGVIIGADGFGLARDTKGWIKVPQLGAVRLGNDCEIGANTTIDRGTLEDTVLEDDVRLDNQIQIAHNVFIGEHTVMAGCSAVAGSAKIGKNCLIGGGVGIIGHLEVCDNVTLQSMALVTHSIKKPGSYSSVSPIQETKEWRRSAVRIKQLDKLAKRLTKAENILKRIDNESGK